jgi:hypothetical protein
MTEPIQHYSTMKRDEKIDYLNTYSARIYCGNCNTHDTLRIPKGTPKPKAWTCTNCGCVQTEAE